MAIDKRVVVIFLIVGIFASMSTIALYNSLAPELPAGPTAMQTSGFLVLDVSAEAPAQTTNEELGTNG